MNKIPFYEGLDNIDLPNVFNEVVNFNLLYAKYIQCNDYTLNPNNILNCTPDDINIDTVNNAYKKLTTNQLSYIDWLKLNNKQETPDSLKEWGIETSKTGILNDSLNVKTMDNNVYNYNYNDILNNYKLNQEKREKLDNKLRDLQNNDESSYLDNKIRYDSTIYSGALWTVLASSVVYYVFMKL